MLCYAGVNRIDQSRRLQLGDLTFDCSVDRLLCSGLDDFMQYAGGKGTARQDKPDDQVLLIGRDADLLNRHPERTPLTGHR